MPFRMPGRSSWTAVARTILIAIALSTCARGFKLSNYPTSDLLYQAAMREYNAHKWENAVNAFEKLTLDLPARDTLLPLAHYYLARAHLGRREYLLAAQSFNRLAESFATDTLADDAKFEAA